MTTWSLSYVYVELAANLLQVEATQACDTGVRVQSARAWHECFAPHRLLALSREDVAVVAVLQPLLLLTRDVVLRSRREADSGSDAWRAARKAARSLSSS